MTIGINPFVLRQCSNDFKGTRVKESDLEAIRSAAEKVEWKDGYAPFCKIAVIESEWWITTAYTAITEANARCLVSEYTTRREGELPYLHRYLKSGTTYGWGLIVSPVLAKYLHVILYSREHLLEEGSESTGADWDIICINAEANKDGAPMTPETMIRNHMGPEFGGSGVPLDPEAYRKSVEFWSKHAMIG